MCAAGEVIPSVWKETVRKQKEKKKVCRRSCETQTREEKSRREFCEVDI